MFLVMHNFEYVPTIDMGQFMEHKFPTFNLLSTIYKGRP